MKLSHLPTSDAIANRFEGNKEKAKCHPMCNSVGKTRMQNAERSIDGESNKDLGDHRLF